MKNFLVIYHAPAEAMAQMATAAPEDKAKGMEQWLAWKASHEGKITDFGAPLMGGQNLAATGSWSQSDREVSGYSIVTGDSLEGVKSMFDGHPHLSWYPGCTIEVHEAVAM